VMSTYIVFVRGQGECGAGGREPLPLSDQFF
jgi:hypothetical protein